MRRCLSKKEQPRAIGCLARARAWQLARDSGPEAWQPRWRGPRSGTDAAPIGRVVLCPKSAPRSGCRSDFSRGIFWRYTGRKGRGRPKEKRDAGGVRGDGGEKENTRRGSRPTSFRRTSRGEFAPSRGLRVGDAFPLAPLADPKKDPGRYLPGLSKVIDEEKMKRALPD